MSISLEQAYVELEKVKTADELRELISQVRTESSGGSTVLYAGNIPKSLEGVEGETIYSGDLANEVVDNNDGRNAGDHFKNHFYFLHSIIKK